MVNWKVPSGADPVDDTFIVEDPDVVTVEGEKLAVTPAGNPVTANVTGPEKVPDGVTDTV